MFLNEAALGKQHIITTDDWTLTQPPTGHDSILAKGRTEPGERERKRERKREKRERERSTIFPLLLDPSKDISLAIDGHSVSVPQGKPISTTYSGSNFSQSEYLVYKESQTCIRYMLQIKFA